MKSFAASLTHKLGPLPIWAWLATAAAGLLVFRRFGGGAGSSGAAGVQPSAGGSSGFGAFTAGDGGGSGSLPSGQQTADPGLTGPGTPVVFDPTGGDNPGGPNEPYTFPDASGDSPTIPRTTVPGNAQGPRPRITAKPLPPDPISRDPAKAFVETGKHFGLLPGKTTKKKHQPARPTSTRGTRAPAPKPAPQLVSEHGKGQATVAHPAAVAHVAPAPAPRAQEHAPAAAAPVRSMADAHPDAGARPVGVATTPAQYRAMGRKMETG